MLKVQNLSIYFGGVRALNDVSFALSNQGIDALIGPNGAGKTTLFNAITGFVPPTSGKILFNDIDITGLKPNKIFERGVVRTFQNLNVVGELTLLENMYLGDLVCKEKGFKAILNSLTPPAKNRADEMYALFDFAGISEWQHRKAEGVPFGVLKFFELARAIFATPALLLLDEPAAGLNSGEKDRMAEMLKSISTGIKVVLVEHDMDFVSKLANKAVCLNFGEIIADAPFSAVRRNEKVIEAYLGAEDGD